MASFPTWTPRNGDMLHLSRENWFDLPAGRYTLREFEGEGVFDIESAAGRVAVNVADLQAQHGLRVLTVIDPAELERDRQAIELRALAPLRSRRPGGSHDVDGLGLFDHARAPTLL